MHILCGHGKGIYLTRHEANKGSFTLQVAQPHLYTPRVICSMSILKSEMTCPQLQWVSPQLSNPFACIYCQHLNQQSIMHMHNQRSLYNSRFNQRMVYNNMADKFIKSDIFPSRLSDKRILLLLTSLTQA